MNSIIRLVTSSLVSRIPNNTFRVIPKHFYVIHVQSVHVTSIEMAQRSITSFFKVTPPKPAVKTEVNSESPVKKVGEDSPVANGKEKVSSKRPRLESSESNSASPKKQSSPPVSTGKKKPVKRQRIESSGSESESPASKATPEPESPKSELKTEATVKTEKVSPKTYASPKNKKKKALSEQNGDTSPSNEVRSPKNEVIKSKESEKSPKSEVKSPKTTAKSAKKGVKREKSVEKEGKKAISKKETVIAEKQETGDKSKSKEKEDKDDKQIVAEIDYNPAKSKYHPISDACWTKGTPVPYLALAKTLELIEGTSARLKIIEILSNYLRSVMVLTPDDLLPSVYLCLNQLAPAYHSLELGIAETYLMKAVGQCTGRSLSQMKSAVSKSGDLGIVAEQARAEQRTMFKPKPLTVRSVFAGLKDIAKITGQASVNKKINKIQSLYVACRHSEARYLIRSLEGKLRIGLAEQSVLQAIALAATLTPPPYTDDPVLDAGKGLDAEQLKCRVDETALTIKTTYCACPDYERVLPALLQHGARALPQRCRLAPGVPLKPMLAHPTKGLSQVFDRFEKESFTCEWKYDGERAQIHVPGDDAPRIHQAAIFSRNQENNTSKYPDVLRRVASLLRDTVTSCVLDCEAVAYDTVNKQILPFQILSTRKRKDAQESEIKVQVCVYLFDLLYLNGKSLVREPLQTRRALLREHFNEVEGCWQLATSRDCVSVEEVQSCLEQSVRDGCEGLMVKALTGPHSYYDIARRSHNWLKLKKDYIEGIGDTIDVVVIGAYLGKGKRAGVYGGFLLACVEPSTDEYQALCKIGTGFSDEDLANFTEQLKEHVIDAPRSYYRYDSSHSADVWVSARVVWEVRCADLSLSPVHRAALGLVHPEKGISLRFPRFVRVRTDKSPEQATSAQQIAEMYLAQDQVKNSAVKHSFADEFY